MTFGASRPVFLGGALLCAAPLLPLPQAVASWVAPAALLSGTLVALTLGNPFLQASRSTSRWLLQGSVVLLGFSMDASDLLRTGQSGLLFSLASIGAVFGVGRLLQRAMGIRPMTGLLVSAGTAICGGSAIAAVSTAVEAPEEDVTVAIGTVFLLNAVALLAFPILGHAMHLSQRAFGIWSGIAIHDVASVVGAGTAYGPRALDVATAVKLSRVVYLAPVTFVAAFAAHRRSASEPSETERRRFQIPWFVGLFVLASILRNLWPAVAAHAGDVKRVAAAGFALSLYLVGTALTRSTLRSVGWRPLLLGLSLWIFVSVASLIAVLR